MNRILLFWIFALSLTLGSCGTRNGHDSAVSTPTDSTSRKGTAPVIYGPDDPARDTVTTGRTDEGVIQTHDGLQKHPYSGEDSNVQKRK